MALVVKDRVKETTTTTGTGTVTLAGADSGFQSFSVLGDGNTTYYTITSGTDWEVGVGTYTASGTTLSRDTILESSNAGSAISLSGTSTVFCTYPAERSVNTEDIGSTVQAYDADTTKNDVANTFTANQTINGNLTVDTNTLYVDSTNNRVGIGTSSPTYKLQIQSGASTILAGADSGATTLTNATQKVMRFGVPHYTNAEEPVCGLFVSNLSTTNEILIGGGTGQLNAATLLQFYTAANNTTLTGTERMRITSTGNVGIGTSSPVTKFQVSGYVTSGGQNYSARFSDAINSTYSIGHQSGMTNLITDTAMAFYTSNTERMRITSSGNVGIGTTNPNSKTEIVGLNDGGEAELLQIRNNAITTGTTSVLRFVNSTANNSYPNGGFIKSIRNGSSDNDLSFGTVDTERMRIKNDGSVGIGTSSPSSQLYLNKGGVSSSDQGPEIILARNSLSGASLTVDDPLNTLKFQTNNASRYWAIQQKSGSLTTTSSLAFVFGTDGPAVYEHMRITSTGNVGIGTSSPSAKLHVEGPLRVSDLTLNYGMIRTGIENNNFLIGYDSTHSTTPDSIALKANAANGYVYFSTNALERMRITSTGNVGIGTSIPDYKLHVANSTDSVMLLESGNTSSSVLLFGDTDSNFRGQIQYNHSNDSMNFFAGGIATTDMIITSAGNVGIGTTSPAAKLDVVGGILAASNSANWNYSNLDLRRNASNIGQARFVAMMLDGDAATSTTAGAYNALWGVYDSAPTTGSTSAALNGKMLYGAYAGHWWYTNGTERMRIASNGNVGIGTSSPSYSLDVQKASGDVVIRAKGNAANNGGFFRAEGADAGSYPGLHIAQGGTHYWSIGQRGDTNLHLKRESGSGNVIVDDANVGIGTSSPAGILDVSQSTAGTARHYLRNTSSSVGAYTILDLVNDTGSIISEFFCTSSTNTSSFGTNATVLQAATSNPLILGTNGTERMRINSSGVVLIGATTANPAANTVYANPEVAGQGMHLVASKIGSGGSVYYANRQSSDGVLFEFRQANTGEGSISVAGTTVSYNGGHLSRFAQLPNSTKDETILKGTVLSNLDDMCVYVNAETNETVDNEQLNKVKVSDVEGDPNVAGVLVSWIYDEQNDVEEINMGMTGDMIIRIAQGVTVNRGDLLMSAGDGTAKPQGDDIVRSKTIAKVTSTSVTCTYEDGSYCVPCVLMAC
jgi:hypothetical protein